MAVPKGKVSKARRDKRRSAVWKLKAPGLVACPKCGAMRLPHRMCPECGTYNGRQVKVVASRVIAIKAEVSQETSAFLY